MNNTGRWLVLLINVGLIAAVCFMGYYYTLSGFHSHRDLPHQFLDRLETYLPDIDITPQNPRTIEKYTVLSRAATQKREVVVEPAKEPEKKVETKFDYNKLNATIREILVVCYNEQNPALSGMHVKIGNVETYFQVGDPIEYGDVVSKADFWLNAVEKKSENELNLVFRDSEDRTGNLVFKTPTDTGLVIK